eukprot:1908359-Alexandrium_andersonii.AAC.1
MTATAPNVRNQTLGILPWPGLGVRSKQLECVSQGAGDGHVTNEAGAEALLPSSGVLELRLGLADAAPDRGVLEQLF